jgi:hypothetical protein
VQLEKVPGSKGSAQQVAVPWPRKYALRCQRPLQIIERVGELIQRDLDEAIGEHRSEKEQDTQVERHAQVQTRQAHNISRPSEDAGSTSVWRLRNLQWT